MKTKRITVFVLIAVMLFTFAFGTFAEGRTISSGSYSAGTVRHKFTTTNYVSKSSSEAWLQIKDEVEYSHFYNESTNALDENGYHKTYLVNYNGNKLSDYKMAYGSETITFYSDSLGDVTDYNLVKLQIYNPKYGTDWYLKTAGTISGASK